MRQTASVRRKRFQRTPNLRYRRNMSRVFAVALLLSVIGCDGERDEPVSNEPSRRCEQVRDHLIDLRLTEAMGVDHDAHRAAMKAALGPDFVASCVTTLSRAQAICVLDARDRASADACTAPQ